MRAVLLVLGTAVAAAVVPTEPAYTTCSKRGRCGVHMPPCCAPKICVPIVKGKGTVFKCKKAPAPDPAPPGRCKARGRCGPDKPPCCAPKSCVPIVRTKRNGKVKVVHKCKRNAPTSPPDCAADNAVCDAHTPCCYPAVCEQTVVYTKGKKLIVSNSAKNALLTVRLLTRRALCPRLG
ncbi:hypothetical protein KFE25_000049 [Diacronema lutheri]|uniref:Uncharacterized protein n=1 Tax=Diacronema lutheri TaxID=2081491 RepID=A0A8J6CAA3_DIALT|nr:hypothetical protein KFE25_000049 [Diacronema lutheri]